MNRLAQPAVNKMFLGSDSGGFWKAGTVIAAAAATLATASAFVNTRVNSDSNNRISLHRRLELVGSTNTPRFHNYSPFLTVAHCEGSPHSQQKEDIAAFKQEKILFGMEKNDSHYYERMTPPSRSEASSHVIFGQLLKPDLIERYHVYRRVNVQGSSDEIVVADVRFGSNLDGHTGIVHGGIISLLLDDAMGFAYEAMGISMAVTASLTVNYRNPVPAGATAIVRVHHTRTKGRKVYFDAQVTSPDGSILYAEGSSLYIIPRSVKQDDEA